MKIILEVEARLDPRSYNDMYVTRFNRKTKQQWTYSTNEIKEYKKTIQDLVVTTLYECKQDILNGKAGVYYKVELEFFADLFFKNGNPRKKDCSNFIKPVEDSISEAIGVDDSYNFVVNTRKLDYCLHGLSGPLIFFRITEIEYSDVVNDSIYLKKIGNI